MWLHDLEADAGRILSEIVEHLEIGDPTGSLSFLKDNSSFQQVGRPPKLTPVDHSWLNLIAGRSIKAAGLEKDRYRADKVGFLRSIIDLPFWLLRVIRMHGGNRRRLLLLLTRWFR